jgi:hypothetical protein
MRAPCGKSVSSRHGENASPLVPQNLEKFGLFLERDPWPLI